MKRFSFLALLLPLAACGPDAIPDIPTLEVGGGGARFMTDAKTPFEAYDKAWSEMTKQHLGIRREIGPNGNRFALESYSARIVRNLQIMKSVLVSPAPSTLDPYLKFYTEVHDLAKAGRFGGNYVNLLNQYEREIHVNYAPDNVQIATEFETTAKDAKKEETAKSAKKEEKTDDLPPPVEKKEDEPKPKVDPPVETPVETPAKDEGVGYRLMFKAWQKSHDELCTAFQAKKDAQARYEEVREALRELAKKVDAKPAERLQVYVTFYEKIHDDTRGFTTLPEGAKDEDVLNDLKIVGAGVAKDFDPARKK